MKEEWNKTCQRSKSIQACVSEHHRQTQCPVAAQSGRCCDSQAGCWHASGSDPCMDLSEKVRVTAHLSNRAVTHTCRISACCWSYGSTEDSQWRESLSSQWSLRLDPSPRTTGCCCHWRRDEEGWRSHRHYWWLRRSLGSHRRGGVWGGKQDEEGRKERRIVVTDEGEEIFRRWQADVIAFKPSCYLYRKLIVRICPCAEAANSDLEITNWIKVLEICAT